METAFEWVKPWDKDEDYDTEFYKKEHREQSLELYGIRPYRVGQLIIAKMGFSLPEFNSLYGYVSIKANSPLLFLGIKKYKKDEWEKMVVDLAGPEALERTKLDFRLNWPQQVTSFFIYEETVVYCSNLGFLHTHFK
ncbi:MAG: hypothetical protein WC761_02235 [Candidatus Paceibacterota bacterium]|jgi:hypothetical protein